MGLTVGARLGPYDVLAKIGEGGMGEVYRARDSRLNRDVAIKVLARTDADPGPQRRLLDEAQAASALNHPNIVAVYDVGTAEGVPFIVSELVAGTSLRAIVSRAPLPIREVLDLAVQMADGLAAAHQAGIAHRDFKPENVMVAADGRVKILDFGLARRSGEGAGGPEVDARTMTLSSAIVGTVPYMSPEQARGAAVDYRTDQFSLGLTLYELLTGRRAFSGDSAAQLLAAIIEDEPEPLAKVNARVPAPVRWVVERCLAKDPRQRYDATADLVRELRTLRERLPEFVPVVDITPAATSKARRVAARAFIVATALALGGIIVSLAQQGADTDFANYRFTPFAIDGGYQSSPSWSPDGHTLAYVAAVDGVLEVFTKNLASSERVQVTHAAFDCREPFWAPDGTRLYYISLARTRDGLWSISTVGGEPELVQENISHAALSPDGRTLAFYRSPVGDYGAEMTLWTASPPSAEPVRYAREPFASRAGIVEATLHFSPDGSRLGTWINNASVMTGQFASELWILPAGGGAPFRAPQPAPDLRNYAPTFSWLPDSRRVVSSLLLPSPGAHLWVIDTDRPAPRLITPSGNFENEPSVSSDGQRLAYASQQADYDLYQLSTDRPTPVPILTTARNEMDPAWSPAGTQMAFTTDRGGSDEIWLRSQNGDFERPVITASSFQGDETHIVSSPAFSPDGQRLAYFRRGASGDLIWISPVAGGPPVQLVPGTEFAGGDLPTWSPDGAWIAYASRKKIGEAFQLTKMRVGARTSPQVLASNALPYAFSKWAPDNSWIAFNSRDGLTLVSPDGASTRTVQEQPWLAFDWSADSRRLYGIRPSDDGKHLTFASVDVASGAERIIGADFMALPVAAQPVRGLSRMSATTFVTSLVRVHSDIWLLAGFDAPRAPWGRFADAIGLRRR